ncbi:MAG: PilZ domain-containing protein [Lachnospiraceae bacterium]|nr:PilZ domain-containing protein [Lachnospiraceae bacterium]
MKITEVMRGSEVAVEIRIQDTPVLFKTKVIFGTKEGLLVEPIMVGDGELIWRRPGMVSIRNLRDDRAYVFRAESIEPMDTQYGRVHMIKSATSGETKNQRNNERLEVIHMGTCRIHYVEYKAIVYDISMGGIAVILDGNVGAKIGDTAVIRFMLGESKHVYEINATVVRFFDVKGRVAIGCQVQNMPLDMMGLIRDTTARQGTKIDPDYKPEEE